MSINFDVSDVSENTSVISKVSYKILINLGGGKSLGVAGNFGLGEVVPW